MPQEIGSGGYLPTLGYGTLPGAGLFGALLGGGNDLSALRAAAGLGDAGTLRLYLTVQGGTWPVEIASHPGIAVLSADTIYVEWQHGNREGSLGPWEPLLASLGGPVTWELIQAGQPTLPLVGTVGDDLRRIAASVGSEAARSALGTIPWVPIAIAAAVLVLIRR